LAPKELPAPNVDFYELAETLHAEELAVLKQVRTFMETKVAPIITKYWVEDAFPFEVLPAFKELNIGGLGIQGYGCAGGSKLLVGLVGMEMSRPHRKSIGCSRMQIRTASCGTPRCRLPPCDPMAAGARRRALGNWK
jgi:hypothetical protein